jgi:hypothetical protein
MSPPVSLPHWPRGTVAFLVTAAGHPHVIPVSAVVRAGDDRILLGLARTRDSLRRLRADPAVTLAICAPDAAFSADGTATVVDETITDRVAAVAVAVGEIHDHRRPTFRIESGVAWHWTDGEAERADAEVHAALRRLAG